MFQLIKCVCILILFLLIFAFWGKSVARWLSIDMEHLPMQILAGFFAYFIVMEIVILPVIFLNNSLRFATVLCMGVTILITFIMLVCHRLSFTENIIRVRITPLCVATVVVLVIMVLLSVLQPYRGYDTTYYVGEMASFLYYGEFWTHDAFTGGLEVDTISLHYALSCFYPLFAIVAYIFQVEARLISMYTVRALCVILFACVAYSWGYELFGDSKHEQGVSHRKAQERNAYIFTIVSLVLSFFLMDNHSSAFMMMVRGYESKGYCAAVVAPMCTLALIKVCKDVKDESNWRLLGLIAWASMPVAMSSMAVIPVAIGIVGLSLMIYHRQIRGILGRCIVCVVPNIILMAWYVLDAYLPMLRG